MAGLRPATFLPGQFHLLARAFEDASAALSKAESIPPIKACLADKVLAAVAAGEFDPVKASAAALTAMRGCLRDCTGCQIGGLPSSFAAGATASPPRTGGDARWN